MVAALNLVLIKNPFEPVETNPQADVWWVPLFIFLKKVFFWNSLVFQAHLVAAQVHLAAFKSI